MRLLITGFGPFPGVADNPSARLVRHIGALARQGVFLDRNDLQDDVICHSHILPTQWQRAGAQLAQHFAAFKPDMALHFGYSARARGLVLERSARNIRCGSPDAKGQRAACAVIQPGAPARLDTDFDLARLVASNTHANCKLLLSDDAGQYLCNEVYYRSLRLSKSALFVHIPALEETSILPADNTCCLKIDAAASAVRTLSMACLAQLKAGAAA